MLAAHAASGGQLSPARVAKWSVHEIPLEARGAYANPYLEAGVDAVFVSPKGDRIPVSGFWEGANKFKIRFTPTVEGRWTFSTKSAADVASPCWRPEPGATSLLLQQDRINGGESPKREFLRNFMQLLPALFVYRDRSPS